MYINHEFAYTFRKKYRYFEKGGEGICKGVEEEGWTGNLEFTIGKLFIQNGKTRRSYCTEQETIFNILG